MLALSGKLLRLDGFGDDSPREMIRVSTNAALPKSLAADTAFLCNGEDAPSGFGLYLATERNAMSLQRLGPDARKATLPDAAGFLGDGDIIRLSPTNQSYRVLFRVKANNNSLLLTERCNHYCLMCSQPPRDVSDDWVMDDVEQLIPMLPVSTGELGLTGGEPTLYGSRLINLLERIKRSLPNTAVHVLSNGRRFSDLEFAKAYARVGHPDLMIGIPLYSDDPARHNFVVQAENAFGETVRGILNLKRCKQRVELRVVIHRQTIDRLPQLAEYIGRNLLFVDQVALMGLEITGFTKGNLGQLWIDPHDYKQTLESTVSTLANYRIPTRVYNHQLCVVSDAVRPYCVQSISDWKREYLPSCAACDLRHRCGGFFSSGIKSRHSDYIAPINETHGAIAMA